MARKMNGEAVMDERAAIGRRLAVLKARFRGEQGGSDFARQFGIAPRSWMNYENGTPCPPELLLRLVQETGVSPSWLLDGSEPMFLREPSEQVPERQPVFCADVAAEVRIFENSPGRFQWELWAKGGFRLRTGVKWVPTVRHCRAAFARFSGVWSVGAEDGPPLDVPGPNGSDWNSPQ